MLYLFTFSHHVLTERLMQIFVLCCVLNLLGFVCLLLAVWHLFWLPVHLPEQCSSAPVLKRWEDTTATRQSWFDSHNEIDLHFDFCHLLSIFACVFTWDWSVRGVEQQVLQMWLWRRRISNRVFLHWYRLFHGARTGLHARYADDH